MEFESDGYPGPDPRQLEVACASGGSYRFIASNGLASSQAQRLVDAVSEAAWAVRVALRGGWEVAVPTDGAAGPAVAALTGELTVAASAGLAGADRAVSLGPTDMAATPVVRWPCASDADCAGTGGACLAVCSSETLTCAAEGGLTLPDGAACVGEDGVCCGGACQAGACQSCL